MQRRHLRHAVGRHHRHGGATNRGRQTLQPVPKRWRHRGCGVNQAVKPGEERPAQRGIAFQMERQPVIARWHAEMQRRRHRAQRSQSGSVRLIRRGLAAVHVVAAAIGERGVGSCGCCRHNDARAASPPPPADAAPGTETARPCARAFEHIIRCVLITAFGSPVEPEVNRILAGASGSTPAKAASMPRGATPRSANLAAGRRGARVS